jgi:hypothetical protein
MQDEISSDMWGGSAGVGVHTSLRTGMNSPRAMHRFQCSSNTVCSRWPRRRCACACVHTRTEGGDVVATSLQMTRHTFSDPTDCVPTALVRLIVAWGLPHRRASETVTSSPRPLSVRAHEQPAPLLAACGSLLSRGNL